MVKTGDDEIIIECQKLIITTGSIPAAPAIPGIDLPGVINSDQALELKVEEILKNG